MPNSNKILCAISGGVDSSVAASILKQKGYDVIGIFMNFWSENEGNSSNKCCSIESYGFARTIANKLNIKLYSLNFKELFRKKVVEYFIQGYEKGITPNPCIVCNREIKFGKLLKIAHNLGATKIATGHYARIIKKGDKFELHRGIDKNKDQSYFLWRIPASSLSSIIFPLGKLTKNAVRKIAKKHQLITFNKKDSQGLCFVGKSNSHFLSKYAKKLLEPGDVVDKNNNIIGTHKGLSFYTIGQRAGFITTKDKWRQKKIDIPPLYVLKIIPDKNILVVGENKDVFQKGLTISQINWLDSSLSHFVGERKTLAQIRYQHTPKPCSISYLNNESDPACGGASGRVRWQSGSSAASMTQSRRSLCRGCAIGLHPRSKPRGIQTIPNKKISVIFKNPERAITPGQSCVFYQQDKVLGGGFIEI